MAIVSKKKEQCISRITFVLKHQKLFVTGHLKSGYIQINRYVKKFKYN